MKTARTISQEKDQSQPQPPHHVTPEEAVDSIEHATGMSEFTSVRLDCEAFIKKAVAKCGQRSTTVRWLKEIARLGIPGKKTADSAFHKLYDSLRKRLDDVEDLLLQQKNVETETQNTLKLQAKPCRIQAQSCLEFNIALNNKEKESINETTEILARINDTVKTLDQTLTFYKEIALLKSKYGNAGVYVPYHLRHLMETKAKEDNQVHDSIEIVGPPTDETVLAIRLKELSKVQKHCNRIILASMHHREAIEFNITNLESRLRSLKGLLGRLHQPLDRRVLMRIGSVFRVSLVEDAKEPEIEEAEESSEVDAYIEHSSCTDCRETLALVEDISLQLGASVFRAQLATQILKDISELRELVVKYGEEIDRHNEWDDFFV